MLIGRATQLGRLADLGTTGGDGRLHVTLVRGEAGIGKTELLRGVADEVTAHGVRAVYGRGDDLDRARPFRLVADLAASIAGLGPLGPPPGLLQAFTDVVRSATAHDAGPARPAGHNVGDAFLHVVEALAVERPLVLLVDDLQWIDVDSAAALARLGTELDDLPITLIGGARPAELLPDVAALFGIGAVVDLAPLDPDDIVELAGAVIGAAPGPRLAAELARAGGNPFFALELLGSLRRHDRLHVNSGRVDLSEFALPEEMRSVVLDRLEDLPVEVAVVLRQATVLGSTFARRELEELVGKRRLGARLRSAVDAGLLDESDDGTFVFRHDLVRAALYDELGPDERAGLHGRAAEVLAAMGAPSTRVASHLVLAPAGSDTPFLDLLERTAWDLRRSSASASLELSERALKLATDDDERSRRVRGGMVEPLAYLGRLADAEATIRAVLGDIETLDPALRAEYLFSLNISVARQDGARRIVEEFGALLGLPGMTLLEEGVLLGCMAQAKIQYGDVDGALPDAERSLAIGDEIGDLRLQVAAWLALAFIASTRGQVAEAATYGRLAGERQHAEGMPFSADLYHGIVEIEADEFDAAARILNTGRTRARSRGELSSQTTYDWALAGRHYVAGDWDDCLAEADGGYARMASGVGMTQAVLIARGMVTRIHVHRGHVDAALAEAERGVDELGRGALAGGDVLLWARAMLLEQQGDPEAALGLLEMELLMTASTRFHLSWRLIFPETVRLAVALGRTGLAEQVAGLAEVGARAAGDLASARACALLCRGLVTADADLLVQATAAYRRSPRITDLARSAAWPAPPSPMPAAPTRPWCCWARRRRSSGPGTPSSTSARSTPSASACTARRSAPDLGPPSAGRA